MDRLLSNNDEIIDLASQNICSLMQLYKGLPLIYYLQSNSHLHTVDLSSNSITQLMPHKGQDYRLYIRSLNLSDNPLESVRDTIQILRNLTPNLQDLQINLSQIEDVDYLIEQMPYLHHLNNYTVDRSGMSSHVAPKSCSSLQSIDKFLGPTVKLLPNHQVVLAETPESTQAEMQTFGNQISDIAVADSTAEQFEFSHIFRQVQKLTKERLGAQIEFKLRDKFGHLCTHNFLKHHILDFIFGATIQLLLDKPIIQILQQLKSLYLDSQSDSEITQLKQVINDLKRDRVAQNEGFQSQNANWQSRFGVMEEQIKGLMQKQSQDGRTRPRVKTTTSQESKKENWSLKSRNCPTTKHQSPRGLTGSASRDSRRPFTMKTSLKTSPVQPSKYSTIPTILTQQKSMSLHQLRQIISELFESKESREQTTIEYLQLFLQQKQISFKQVKDAARQFTSYQDIELFNKIIANQIDEQFWHEQQNKKKLIDSCLLQNIKKKHAKLQQSEVLHLVSQIQEDLVYVESTLAKKIYDYFNVHAEIKPKLRYSRVVKDILQVSQRRHEMWLGQIVESFGKLSNNGVVFKEQLPMLSRVLDMRSQLVGDRFTLSQLVSALQSDKKRSNSIHSVKLQNEKKFMP